MSDNSLYQELLDDPRFKAVFESITLYGVAGTNGSGKDTLMELFKELRFFVYNTSADLRELSYAVFGNTNRGGNQTPMGQIGNAERAVYPGGMVDLGLLDWWMRAAHLPEQLRPRGLVIGSIRAAGEAVRLKEFGGKLLVTDADANIRYGRLQSRLRADERNISFEEFVQQEKNELAVGETDPAKFGMAKVIDMADIVLLNEFNDVERFKKDAKAQLGIC